MARSLAIHVLPDSNPDNIGNMLRMLSQDSSLSFAASKDLVEYLREVDTTANDWVQSTSRAMGLLQQEHEAITLSPLGYTLAQMRDEVRGDLYHFLLYTGWSAQQPTEFLQSWGYRQTCDTFWQHGQMALKGATLDTIVGEVIATAEATFAALPNVDLDRVSFSNKSLTGVRKWLDALEPTVVVDGNFERRHFCPPELMILGLDYILGDDEQTTEIDLLLTPEKREALSRLCLMEPDSLDAALDWALATFGHIASPGTGAGFYGRIVRVHKRPTIEDLLR